MASNEDSMIANLASKWSIFGTHCIGPYTVLIMSTELSRDAYAHVLDNLFIFSSMHEHANSEVNTTPCSSNLLVVSNDGVRSLEVNDEAKIRFIKAHTERSRRYQSLDTVVKQAFLEKFAISIGVIAELSVKTGNSSLCLDATVVGVDLLELRVLHQPRRQLRQHTNTMVTTSHHTMSTDSYCMLSLNNKAFAITCISFTF